MYLVVSNNKVKQTSIFSKAKLREVGIVEIIHPLQCPEQISCLHYKVEDTRAALSHSESIIINL